MRDQRKEQDRRAARGRVNFDGMYEDEDPDAYDRMRDEALMEEWLEHEHVIRVTGEVVFHEHGPYEEGHTHIVDTGYEIVRYE